MLYIPDGGLRYCLCKNPDMAAKELVAFNDLGLAPGGILEGLSISFDWLAAGIPGPQSFELFGADGLSLGLFGNTYGGDIPPIPEPQTFMLLGTGILGLAAYYRRNRKR